MGARTPEALDALFAEALNRGDLDALVALYEPNASLMSEPGKVITGKAAIREAHAGFVAAKPRITIDARTLAQTGDVALVSATWQVTMTGSDGKPATFGGTSAEVMRRQPDGQWLFAIDFPFGIVAVT